MLPTCFIFGLYHFKPTKLEGKFNKFAIRLANAILFWLLRSNISIKMSVVELRPLRWIGTNLRKNKIRNEEICVNIGVAPIGE